jgi:hypothetical protein
MGHQRWWCRYWEHRSATVLKPGKSRAPAPEDGAPGLVPARRPALASPDSLLLHLASLVLGQERLVGHLTTGTTRPHLEAWPGDDQTRRDTGRAARRLLLEAAAIAAIAAIATMTARLGTLAIVAAVAAEVVLLQSATARTPEPPPE